MSDQMMRGGADFSVSDFPNQTVKSGEVIVGTVSAAFPSVAVRSVMLKAAKGNAGTVYIGVGGTTVTASDGTVDATTGFQMVAGDITPVFTIDNLSKLGGIASADGQVVTYLATL